MSMLPPEPRDVLLDSAAAHAVGGTGGRGSEVVRFPDSASHQTWFDVGAD